MIKVFTLNKNNKIELTKQELEKLLNESFWEGYQYKNNSIWTYTSPLQYTAPYITTSNTTTSTADEIKANDGSTLNSIIIKTKNLGD